MSENAKQIKEILGELPEKPSSFDLSLRYVAQCLELHVARRLTGYLRTLNKKEEQALQRETENLYQTWDLGRIHPDLEAIRERLKPAALVTVQPQIKDLSPLTCRVGFLKGLEELLRTHSPRLREEDYIWTFDIVNLTTPWELIERTWQDAAIQEKTLRKPVDQLYTTIFGDHTFMEYCTIPVSAKSRIDKGPGVYFIADQYKTHSFIIEQTEQFLFDHRELLNLLRWRWNAKPPSESGLVEIPLLAQEFKTINSREAANQCAADLITGATINELLDIQFPCYGLVVTLEECSLYAARAQLQMVHSSMPCKRLTSGERSRSCLTT
ncbi:hypothetical protein K435DRAFT_476361 [Dendrothele bispora CBS 962.96]|uniref:Uncharacterized protein n=1 Tax=Dendrothele bispora (strain CBS 962.96) TaxID=1314807 RepID=A0A4S8MBW2_DENBC|nr:hypothetical protein K435DRAFT_476361 [Dendrothele bispora CBS 962.96]